LRGLYVDPSGIEVVEELQRERETLLRSCRKRHALKVVADDGRHRGFAYSEKSGHDRECNLRRVEAGRRKKDPIALGKGTHGRGTSGDRVPAAATSKRHVDEMIKKRKDHAQNFFWEKFGPGKMQR